MATVINGSPAEATGATERTFYDVVTEFDHITLPVRDLNKAARFYTQVLNMKILTPPPSPEVIAKRRAEGSMRFPSCNVSYNAKPKISLFEYDRGFPEWDQDHPHTAFCVRAEDIDWCAQRLRDQGIPYDGPSLRGPAGGASLYFNDPDGNKLEFHAPTGYTGPVENRPPIWTREMLYDWNG